MADVDTTPLIIRKEPIVAQAPAGAVPVRRVPPAADKQAARQAAAQWTRASIVLASVLGVALLAYFLAPHQSHESTITSNVKDAARQAGQTGREYQVRFGTWMRQCVHVHKLRPLMAWLMSEVILQKIDARVVLHWLLSGKRV